MIRWTPTRPSPRPQRWQSREEILKAHLVSLSPEKLRSVRPDYYWLRFGQKAWLAERLRREVASRPLAMASQSIPATVSIGIAARSPEMTGISDLMRAADKALYEAKRAGRNRVMCSLSPRDVPQTVNSTEEPAPAQARTAATIIRANARPS